MTTSVRGEVLGARHHGRIEGFLVGVRGGFRFGDLRLDLGVARERYATDGGCVVEQIRLLVPRLCPFLERRGGLRMGSLPAAPLG
jgi:hypothetical protein